MVGKVKAMSEDRRRELRANFIAEFVRGLRQHTDDAATRLLLSIYDNSRGADRTEVAAGGREENWARLAQLETEGDDRGPKRMLLAAADLSGGLKLSFEKAQAFGARAPVYTFDVPNAGRAGGHRITFTWERDD